MTGRRRAFDLVPRAVAWKPDLVIHEEMELAGAVAAAVTGARHAIHALGVMLPRWVWDGMAPIVAELARPARADVFGASYLRISPPSLPAPAADQWPDVRLLRPAFGRPAAGERLSDELAAFLAAGDDPVVHLTLGTVFHESPGVLETALAGLRRLAIRVVVTTGPGVDPASLGPQPANVLVVPYVPHALLLPSCALVVSHAGAGIMFGALAHGLPQLLLPQGADQPANAAACVDAGVADALSPGEVTKSSVADAAARLLADPAVARRAVAIGDELAVMPGPDEVLRELTGEAAAAA